MHVTWAPAPRVGSRAWQVHGAFMAQQQAQLLRLYVGATALGATARRWMRAPLAATIDEAPRWSLVSLEQLGDDVCLEYLLEQAE